MEIIRKYWIIILFIGNILAQYPILTSVSDYFFYGSLGVGVIVILKYLPNLLKRETFERFSFLYVFFLTLIFYQLFIGWQFIWPKTYTYIISKTIVNLMIIVTLLGYRNFYTKNFLQYIPPVIALMLIIGYFTHNLSVNGRNTLGFGNFNSTGAIAAISFGIIFINRIKNKWQLLVTLICLWGVLMSGSRTGLGIVIISIIIKYGVNNKLFVGGFIILCLIFYLIPNIGYEFSGISRFSEAVSSGDFTSGREIERQGTLLMIRNSPLIGNGIYSGLSEQAYLITHLGSHSGYLDILKWFGIPIGGAFIIYLIYKSLILYLNFFNSDNYIIRTFLFIIISILLAANYEEYIIGVNQMITTLFFVSFGILQDIQYNLKNRLCLKTYNFNE